MNSASSVFNRRLLSAARFPKNVQRFLMLQDPSTISSLYRHLLTTASRNRKKIRLTWNKISFWDGNQTCECLSLSFRLAAGYITPGVRKRWFVIVGLVSRCDSGSALSANLARLLVSLQFSFPLRGRRRRCLRPITAFPKWRFLLRFR